MEGAEHGETGARAAEGQDEQSPLGVLFVHGIGQQRRGETLNTFAAPVYRWFRGWLGEKCVELRETVLTEDAEAPAHCRLHVREEADAEARECLLAECHWAESFPEPRFGEVARWALLILPFTVSAQFVGRCRTLLSTNCGRPLTYPRVAFELGTYLAAFFLSAVVQVLVIALLLLALVPFAPLRSYLLSLELKIAGFVGDSYVLLNDPLKENAILSRVHRNLRWLEEQGCDRIAVVAHSQGAAIAYRALLALASGRLGPREPEKAEADDGTAAKKDPEPKLIDRVRLLFSFGSGLGKLHDIELVRARGSLWLWLGWVAVVSIVLAAILLPEVAVLAFTDPDFHRQFEHWGRLGLVVSGAVGLGCLVAIGFKTADGRGPLLDEQLRFRWVDVFASRDPVPSGPLLRKDYDPLEGLPFTLLAALRGLKRPRIVKPESRMVHNRNSIWTDHSSYMENTDEFVTLVGSALAAEIPVSLGDAPELTLAPARRGWRVGWLSLSRVVVSLSAAVVIGRLHQLGILGDLATHTVDLIDRAWALQGAEIEDGLARQILDAARGNRLCAAVTVLLLHFLWYKLLVVTWRVWDRSATRRFFERDAQDVKILPSLLLVALAILPALAMLVPAISGGEDFVRWSLFALQEIAFPVATAAFLSSVLGASASPFAYFLADKWGTAKHRATLDKKLGSTFLRASTICTLLLFAPSFWLAREVLPHGTADPWSLHTNGWMLAYLLLALPVAAALAALWLGRFARLESRRGSRWKRWQRQLLLFLAKGRKFEVSEVAAGLSGVIAGLVAMTMSALIFLDVWRSPSSVTLFLVALFVMLPTIWRAHGDNATPLSRRLANSGYWLAILALAMPSILANNLAFLFPSLGP